MVLRKHFYLAFIITALSFVIQLQAMEELESQTKSVPTLKYLAIMAIYKYKNRPKYKDDENLDLSILPYELKSECLWTPLEPLVKEHYNSLKSLQHNEHLEITGNNLRSYDKLLRRLVDIGVDIKPILFAINNDFISSIRVLEQLNPIFVGYIRIKLNDINLLLNVLIQRNTQNNTLEKLSFEQEIIPLKKIISYAFSNNRTELQKLLTMNEMLPPLDYIMDEHNSNFLRHIVLYTKDIMLLNQIINNEKNKDNDYWLKLLNMRSGPNGSTILHYITYINQDEHTKEAVYTFIIELMKDKGLNLDQLVNVINDKGQTPLMKAAQKINYKIVKLLIADGANKSLKCNRGLTALDYVGEGMNEWFNSLRFAGNVLTHEIYDPKAYQAAACRKLLREREEQPKKRFCSFM